MRISRLIGAGLCAAIMGAALMGAAPASAATYILTFGGRVSSGLDFTNSFHNGPDLTGKDFSVSYSFDYPSGDVDVTMVNNQAFALSQVHAYQSNVVLTIGGWAVSMGSNNVDYERRADRDAARSIGAESNYVVNQRNGPTMEWKVAAGLSSVLTPFFDKATAFAPFAYTINDGRGGDDVRGDGSFSIVGWTSGSELGTPYALGSLEVRHVSLAEAADSAVPEPASWAMLIVGFGAIGGTLRRRRSVPHQFVAG